MKRVACYVRVSTVEQKNNGLSVDSQIMALEAYCKENNYEIVNIYNDAGRSAHASYKTRPALLQLIKDCENKKIDLIIFTKLDRWFRSLPDYYAVQEHLDKYKVPWKAIWEDYETETSAGKFKVNIMLSIAQAEAERTSERIKAINDYRRAKGDFVGGYAPIGYKIENKKLVIDEDKRECINAVFKKYLETFNVSETMKVAATFGVNLDRRAVRRIFKSEVYAGNAYGFACESYITMEQFKVINESITNRAATRTNSKRVYIFSGILKCGCCGCTMSGHIIDSRYKGKRYIYKGYECNSHNIKSGCTNGRRIHEGAIEKYLIANLNSIIETYIDAGTQIIDIDVEKDIRALKAKLKRIGDRYEDGDISREEYREKRDKIKYDIDKLSSVTTVKREISRLPENWSEQYKQLDDEHKQQFWHRLVKTIINNKDGSYTVLF